MEHHSTIGTDQAIFGFPNKEFKGKLILGIHGMGDQFRNDFIQGVAHLVARHLAKEKGKEFENQAITLPLGAWDRGRETHVDDEAVFFSDCRRPGEPLEGYAFAEIYWADVARSMEKEDYRIEEVRHWAGTVVERIGQRYGGRPGMGPKSLHLASFVVEEIAETLTAIGALVSMKQLLGFNRRAFDQTIVASLGDVQQVGDFSRQREKIRLRFLNRLTWLSANYPNAEIHIVAHSEGAAASLYSLLSALDLDYTSSIERLQKKWTDDREMGRQRNTSKWFDAFWVVEQAAHPATRKEWVFQRWQSLSRNSGADDHLLAFNWVHEVRSYTTLGSPIDKHLILWPEMWADFQGATWTNLEKGKIRWRNFYDYADPVGYEHDTARDLLVGTIDPKTGEKTKDAKWGCDFFEFTEEDDHGFRRYPIPGKAHTDYFKDYKLFSYIVKSSFEGNGKPERKLRSNGWGYIGRVLPFVVVCVVIFASVFILHRGLLGDTSGPDGWKKAYGLYKEIYGDNTSLAGLKAASSGGIFGCGMLLLGTTVLGRIGRLSTSWFMHLVAIVVYALGVVAYWKYPGYFSLEAAYRFGGKALSDMNVFGSFGVEVVCRGVFVAASFLAVVIGVVADWVAASQRTRPIWGLRFFVGGVGLLLFLLLIVPRFGDDSNVSVAVVAGAWAMFVVCLWIGTLLFDLAFCWQRYINVERSWLSVVREAEAQSGRPAARQAESEKVTGLEAGNPGDSSI